MVLATAMLTSTSCSNASKEDVAGQHNIQVTKAPTTASISCNIFI